VAELTWVDGQETLADIVRPGLDLLFVGYNPSLPAIARRQYYGNPANAFWKELHACGLVPAFYGTPGDDVRVLDHGIGITDVVKRPTATSRELAKGEYLAGFARLSALVAEYRPRTVCFVGVDLLRRYEAQAARFPADIAVTAVYSTSGLANGYWRERREGFARLAASLGRRESLQTASGLR